MNFGAPWMLWALLAALPLAAVYFLKVRPRRRQVTAFFLWQKLLREKKASSLFQRLRDLLSLLLLLAALIAAILAAAGLRWSSQDPRDVLVIVDVSPSMSAREKGRLLSDAAKDTVRDMIRSLNGSRRMALATAADELLFVSHLSDNPRDLTDAVARISPRQVPVAQRTLEAINSYARIHGAEQKARHRVVLITDGQGGWDGLAKEVEVLRVGPGRMDNAGLVAADMQWLGVSGGRAAFFYRVASSYSEPRNVDLELRHVDTQTAVRLIPLTIPSNSEVSATVELDDIDAGRWSAKLLTDDALASDNEVPMGLPDRDPVAVKVPKDDAYFFQRCVQAFERATGTLALVDRAASMVIARGAVPSGDEDVLVFAPQGESPFWSGGNDAMDIALAEPVLKDHPLLRNLDCEHIAFAGARKLKPADGSLVLVRSDAGDPLMWKSDVAGRRAVVVNLDPLEAEFFLSPWFPVIVHNAATHLTGREGESLSVRPTGEKDSRMEIGHWQDERGAWTGSALLSPNETMLAGLGPEATNTNIERGHPLAQALLFAALLVMAVESWLYHRRKVG